ncbi:MAG TPA: AAA family ATPase [Burkholderiales bacterium]
MKVIAVANRKGGCGKTTTAINLGACLARKNFRVLLLDLDPQGHASLGLNVYQEDARDLYHVITRQAKLEEIIIANAFPGLDVAPATPSLAAVEHLPFEQGQRDRLLKEPLESVDPYYDYAVVDCPPSLGLLSMNALAAADLVLIPIEMSRFGISGVERMYETVALLREREERDIPIRVLPSLVDSRTRLCRHFLREVWQRFADDVSPGAVLYTVRLREAVHKGVPIVAYDPASPAAKQYDALAQELIAALRGERQFADPAAQMTAIGRAYEEARKRSDAIAGQEVVLRFPEYAGRDLRVAGDFNNWEPDQGVATRRDGDVIEKVLNLQPGVYQYRLVVDGQWQDDGRNPDRLQNLMGGYNSLLRVIEQGEPVSA